MHGVGGRARPQGSIVCNLTLHFCKRLFPRLEPMTSSSQGNNFILSVTSRLPPSITQVRKINLFSKYPFR
ncbi:hypothetical protein R3W88_030628 [Solanum pinnatisectum]|uniref:Uncharacterized protein n=1 Tax=Solanum pinnatisectum TaxID=50273 RepID=A0AAV9LJ28_9SOLN|nr:hypothetical protein R3W88_030628 [Solanum pinnatisectum]